MELIKKMDLAQKIQSNINTHLKNMWPGFTPVPFILYDADNQVAVGENWPEHYQNEHDDVWIAKGTDPLLMGNTATMYHGRMVAIWDTRTWDESSLNEVEATAYITHEMFHAYQHTAMNLPYANDLLLPDYPHTPKSIALVMEENKLLTKPLTGFITQKEAHDLLVSISMLRRYRKEEIGAEYIEYDCRLESMEGVAAYVEVKMKSALDGCLPFESATSYLPILMQNDSLLVEYRYRCYSAGLALCLVADVACPEWKVEWPQTNQTLFDWMNEKLSLESPIKEADEIICAFKQEKNKLIDEFKSKPLMLIEGNINILGFDPMNLICVGGFCLHKHGRVFYNNEEHLLTEPFLTEYSGNIMNVTRMWVGDLY